MIRHRRRKIQCEACHVDRDILWHNVDEEHLDIATIVDIRININCAIHG